MAQHLAQLALLVDDYDRAIAWYTDMLGFELIEDTPLSDVKRWVLMAPKGSPGCRILLARAASPEQVAAIGNQSGGRVFLFLHTDDFATDYAAMRSKEVTFVREAEQQPWGRVAVFRDLYGNLWDLVGSAR
ncbi:MAG TPA: VOC family protein [Flavobacteriales bacterium]|nr:VOC family protein [Flavobacteriales bacterium]